MHIIIYSNKFTAPPSARPLSRPRLFIVRLVGGEMFDIPGNCIIDWQHNVDRQSFVKIPDKFTLPQNQGSRRRRMVFECKFEL